MLIPLGRLRKRKKSTGSADNDAQASLAAVNSSYVGISELLQERGELTAPLSTWRSAGAGDISLHESVSLVRCDGANQAGRGDLDAALDHRHPAERL
jgi:hypothetical protein